MFVLETLARSSSEGSLLIKKVFAAALLSVQPPVKVVLMFVQFSLNLKLALSNVVGEN
jgi:hypothetical protein